MNNTFIDIMTRYKIANKPKWTISTNDKRPLNSKLALKFNFDPKKCNVKESYNSNPPQSWGRLAKNNDDLVTLPELINCPNAPKQNYALKADINNDNLLLVDIENEYDKGINHLLKKLTPIYAEYSKHGGIHMIIYIPNNILTDQKYSRLFKRTTIKFAETNNEHSGIELFFNNHYLTFTQKIISVANNTLNHNATKQFLDLAMTNLQSTEYKQHNLIDSSNIPTDAMIIVKHALTFQQERYIMKKIHNEYNSSDDNKKNTLSEIEYRCISKIANSVIITAKNNYKYKPFKPNELLNEKSPHDPKILVWVVYLLAKKYLQYRDKWDDNRGDLSYLQYTVQRAVNASLQYNNVDWYGDASKSH